MRKCIGLVLVGALFAFGAGCSDEGGSGGSGGTAGTGGTGGSQELCSTPGETVTLPGEIAESVMLTADCTYRIAQTVFVTGGTMTVEEGTRVIDKFPGRRANLLGQPWDRLGRSQAVEPR